MALSLLGSHLAVKTHHLGNHAALKCRLPGVSPGCSCCCWEVAPTAPTHGLSHLTCCFQQPGEGGQMMSSFVEQGASHGVLRQCCVVTGGQAPFLCGPGLTLPAHPRFTSGETKAWDRGT